MTVGQLMAQMDNAEYMQWAALAEIRQFEREKEERTRSKGMRPRKR